MLKQHTHIGVYALIIEKGQILFIKKSRGPYTGKWDLPGGGFEFGESPLETLYREVKEETGMQVLETKLLDVLSTTVTYQNNNTEKETVHHLGILYQVKINAKNNLKESGDGEDSLGAKWIEFSEINKKLFSPFVYQITEYLSN